MAGNRNCMTKEEHRAFQSYAVPEPVRVKGSGKYDSPGIRKMCKSLEENETFVIRGGGRLEHSAIGASALNGAKKFNIAIVDIPLIVDGSDTGSEMLRYMMSDILLQIQACMDREKQEYLREKERENARKPGGRGKERPQEFEELREKWVNWEISANQAAKQLGISHVTFRKWAREKGDRLAQRPEKAYDNFEELRKLWAAGRIPASEAAKQLGISQVAFLQRVMETP